MTELFTATALRVEQPRKVVQTQNEYAFLDADDNLVATARDQEVRTRWEATRVALPQGSAGPQVLVLVTDADDNPLLLLDKYDAWHTRVREPALDGGEHDSGRLVGLINGNSTRRQYTFHDGSGRQLGQIRGDLKLRRFVATDRKGRTVAKVEKKWMGLRAEVFTNADRYSVEITGELDGDLRKLVVIFAVVLDLTAYESKDVV